MKMNHVNLTVDDVAGASKLLQKHFGLRPAAEERKNFVVLFDDDNFVLTLIGAGRSGAVEYPRTFHIGFGQPSREYVNEIHRRLVEDGYDIQETPREEHHAWTFYFKAPGGFTVEVLSA
jgi:lactoylglutathione lyase